MKTISAIFLPKGRVSFAEKCAHLRVCTRPKFIKQILGANLGTLMSNFRIGIKKKHYILGVLNLSAQNLRAGARSTITQLLFPSRSAEDLFHPVTRSLVGRPAHFFPSFRDYSKFTLNQRPGLYALDSCNHSGLLLIQF